MIGQAVDRFERPNWLIEFPKYLQKVEIVQSGKGFDLFVDGGKVLISSSYEPESPHWPTYGQFEKCVDIVKKRFIRSMRLQLDQMEEMLDADIALFAKLDSEERRKRRSDGLAG